MGLREAIEQSIDNSLVQLGRGSGITDEHRARMVKIIAYPIILIVEEAVERASSTSEGGE